MFLGAFILTSLIIAGIWTAMSRSLLRSAIGLALTSAILTAIMFMLEAPLAAVFELSVCAGLIPVLFISVISLTQPQTSKEIAEHMKARFSRFWLLPIIVIGLAILVYALGFTPDIKLPLPEAETDARFVLWHLRQLDLLGQVIILLTGVFGVAILFKERKKSA